jgi:hypothetical protein
LCPDRAGFGVNSYAAHQREIDHEAVVTEGPPADIVASSADGGQDIVLSGKPNSCHHVGSGAALGNQPGALVYDRVMDASYGVIDIVTRSDDLSSERGLKLRDRVFAYWVPLGVKKR